MTAAIPSQVACPNGGPTLGREDRQLPTNISVRIVMAIAEPHFSPGCETPLIIIDKLKLVIVVNIISKIQSMASLPPSILYLK